MLLRFCLQQKQGAVRFQWFSAAQVDWRHLRAPFTGVSAERCRRVVNGGYGNVCKGCEGRFWAKTGCRERKGANAEQREAP